MGRVTVVGSLNLDLVVTTRRHPTPGETVLGSTYAEHAGGKGLNQAIAAARAGATTSIVGALGTDDAADALRLVASDASVDVARVVSVTDPSGRALITVDASGENSIVVVPGANERLRPTDVEPVDADCDVLLCQLEIPIETVVAACRSARAAGATTVLDPAPAAPLPDELLRDVDVIIPNEHEVELLGGVDALLDLGVSTVIVTRGAAGASVHRRGRDDLTIPAFGVDVIDTTGAGDAFRGALGARLAAGDGLGAATEFATAAGALATTAAGAVPSLPGLSAIRSLVASRTAPH